MNINQRTVFSRVLVIALILLSVFVSEVFAAGKKEKQYIDLTAEEFYQLNQENRQNDDFIILDVRTPAEYNEEHIADSEMIDFYADDFADLVDQLDKSKTYAIYCRSGNRSGKTLKMMEEMGFNTVYNMLGGIKAWKALSLPVVKK